MQLLQSIIASCLLLQSMAYIRSSHPLPSTHRGVTHSFLNFGKIDISIHLSRPDIGLPAPPQLPPALLEPPRPERCGCSGMRDLLRSPGLPPLPAFSPTDLLSKLIHGSELFNFGQEPGDNIQSGLCCDSGAVDTEMVVMELTGPQQQENKLFPKSPFFYANNFAKMFSPVSELKRDHIIKKKEMSNLLKKKNIKAVGDKKLYFPFKHDELKPEPSNAIDEQLESKATKEKEAKVEVTLTTGTDVVNIGTTEPVAKV